MSVSLNTRASIRRSRCTARRKCFWTGRLPDIQYYKFGCPRGQQGSIFDLDAHVVKPKLPTSRLVSAPRSFPLIFSAYPPIPVAYQSEKIRMDDEAYDPTVLLSEEVFWRDHQKWLLDCGYILRARYQPNWKPSWIEKGTPDYLCEDALSLPVCCFRILLKAVLLIIVEESSYYKRCYTRI